MENEVFITQEFQHKFKKLSKKHSSLGSDLAILIEELLETPHKGTPLGKGFYKIRMKIESKGKDKSGGFRVITYATMFFLDIYRTYAVKFYVRFDCVSPIPLIFLLILIFTFNYFYL